MGSIIDEKVQFFSNRLKEKLASHLSQIMLFGSHARGDAHPGSDYDFLVVLQNKQKQYIDIIRQTEVEFLNRFDTLSSSLVYDAAEWEMRKGLPISINISREGVVL